MKKDNSVSRQQGLSLIGLLFVGLIVVFLLVIGFKLVPAVTEYIAIEKAIRKINKDTATVSQIRREFQNYEITDDIKSISAKDLDITKENDRIVISYAYSYSIPIMDNVRLVIDFAGSTRTRSKPTP
jgi:competence protein ComGC